MVEVRWLFYCVVLCMLRSEQFPGFGHAASQLGFGGGRKVVCSCVCVFERVLSTVCGAIRSQSDVFLRVFERGFGNGLRGNWASEVSQSGVFFLCVFERVLRTVCGAIGLRRGRKVLFC